MAKEEVASTTVKVIETLCDKIGPFIKQIAASLGTSSEHIMILFTKQVYADAAENFISFFICGGIAFAWMKFSKLWFHKIENDGWHTDGFAANIILSIVIYLICAIIASVGIICGVKMLINPEYYAFTEVLGKITGLIGK